MGGRGAGRGGGGGRGAGIGFGAGGETLRGGGRAPGVGTNADYKRRATIFNYEKRIDAAERRGDYDMVNKLRRARNKLMTNREFTGGMA